MSFTELIAGVRGDVAVKMSGEDLKKLMPTAEAVARYGLSMSDVQDVIAAAVGGRAAGQVFEGDRRFDLVVRPPDEIRSSRRAGETADSVARGGN